MIVIKLRVGMRKKIERVADPLLNPSSVSVSLPTPPRAGGLSQTRWICLPCRFVAKGYASRLVGEDIRKDEGK